MELEDFLKSKGLFYTRDLINIMDETINLPKIMKEYAKIYHESELEKIKKLIKKYKNLSYKYADKYSPIEHESGEYDGKSIAYDEIVEDLEMLLKQLEDEKS